MLEVEAADTLSMMMHATVRLPATMPSDGHLSEKSSAKGGPV